MSSPADLRFAESHEWFRLKGDTVTVGLTKYAADELTDVTYVQIKPVGSTINAGESMGEVESVKTTSDIYSAISGKIVEVNPAVNTDPALVNSDPFGKGWLVKIKTTDPAPLNSLMDSLTYDERHPVG